MTAFLLLLSSLLGLRGRRMGRTNTSAASDSNGKEGAAGAVAADVSSMTSTSLAGVVVSNCESVDRAGDGGNTKGRPGLKFWWTGIVKRVVSIYEPRLCVFCFLSLVLGEMWFLVVASTNVV